MFPPFDNLVPEEFEQNAAALDISDEESNRHIIESLTRLRTHWEVSQQDRPEPDGVPSWYESLRRVLQGAPRPADVARAVEEYVRRAARPGDAFQLFAESPRSLSILGRLASASPFLTRILLRDSVALDALSSRRGISDMKSREQFLDEARQFAASRSEESPVSLRRYQRRELLRIGMCDAFGLLTLRNVTLQLSLLADAVVITCLQEACRHVGLNSSPLAVIAMGKHGGEELNYSSDIDLLLVADAANRDVLRVARRLVDGLNEHLTSGFLYRVDLRLRPWGNAGPMVTTPESFLEYLRTDAQLWEKQAMLKARVIAGNPDAGHALLSGLPDVLYTESAQTVRDSIRSMKAQIESHLQQAGRHEAEVKLGSGSIRDIEFLVQSLQLIHGATEPRVASANTLDALIRLADFGRLDAFRFQQLRDGYVFLRTLEHALQLQHNRQTHEIPRSAELRSRLAQRMDYPDADSFLKRFDEHRRAIRSIFDEHFTPSPSAAEATTDLQSASRATDDRNARQREVTPVIPWNAMIAQLSRAHPVCVHRLSLSSPEDSVLAVCAADEPGLTATVSGVLFAAGLDIRSGEVVIGPGTLRGEHLPPDIFAAVFIVSETDRMSDPQFDSRESSLQDQLERLILTGRSRGIEIEREELLRLFCARMMQMPGRATASDVRISEQTVDELSATLVEIRSTDAPGLLFELANALSLCGFRIIQARIAAVDGQILDELHVTESGVRGPLTPRRREELTTAVTLIQQFTLWLPASADPYTVLLRFRQLLRRLLQESPGSEGTDALRSPDVLMKVARVLGLSRHLWEDALLLHHSDVLPLLRHSERLASAVPAAELKDQLARLIETASIGERPEILDRFKDHHLFRIELRHVLGHSPEFGRFSTEVTELAEVILQAAARIAEQELLSESSVATSKNTVWALAGLGKVGGTEMGFASDIELLLIYDADDSGSNAEEKGVPAAWFEQLLTRITQRVKSKRDGIFEIDLRMRPWGQAGSAAVSLQQVGNYYSASGSAWPFERQAMVKLRCIAGDDQLRRRIHQLRDDIIYDGRPFDFDAMKALREQQIRQYVRPGTIHAKLSEGGLVDCEYSVQALQLTFGRDRPALRTENTLQALQAAESLNFLSPERHRTVRDACVYLRQLIDGLRMVRGNAQDLTVPQAGTPDRIQLDQRLRHVYGHEMSLDRLEDQLAVIRDFADAVRLICNDDNCG